MHVKSLLYNNSNSAIYNYMEEMQVNDIGTAKHLVLVLSLEISPLHCNDKTLKLEME